MGIEQLSQAWPDWKVGEKIGESTFATVYKASKSVGLSTEHAAVKVINRADDSWLKVIEPLKGCPFILVPDDYAIVGDELFVREELLTPWPFFRKSKEELKKVCIDVLSALEECAKHNIVHKDVKPDNIFRTVYGTYKLGDFNAAALLSASDQAIYGCKPYIAPEVYLGNPHGISSDLYSLGLVLYYGLQGSPPRDREEFFKDRMAGKPLPIDSSVSNEMAQVLRKACAFAPRDRYHTPTEFKEALQAAHLEEITVFKTSEPDTATEQGRTFAFDDPPELYDAIQTTQSFPLKNKLLIIARVATAVLGVLTAAYLICKKFKIFKK
ncbi:MAG: protein kinase [Clostridiales bacterium]|jgi:serine/threonine protein kinase|nr:protein kinase [Clostridiales bacterium]